MKELEHLFSKARGAVLRLLFGDAGREYHLRDMARMADLAPAALQRELVRMVEAGLVLSRRDGNRRYFRAAADHPLFPELHRLVVKTSGAVAKVREALKRTNGINLAFLFGSTAAGTMTPESDIDVLVIGSVGLRRISTALRGVAEALGREINPCSLTPAEWTDKMARGDAFVTRLAAEPKLWLKGGADELAALEG